MKHGTSGTAISISGTIRRCAPWGTARSCSGCSGTRNEPSPRREAGELARRLRHAPSLIQALWLAGEYQIARRVAVAVTATATELLALCEEHRIPHWRATAFMFIGWAQACSGEV